MLALGVLVLGGSLAVAGCEPKEHRIEAAIDVIDLAHPPGDNEDVDITATSVGSQVYIIYKDDEYRHRFAYALAELERLCPTSIEALEQAIRAKMDDDEATSAEDIEQGNLFRAMLDLAGRHREARLSLQRIDAELKNRPHAAPPGSHQG
jgi:hypothetical protein